MSDSLNWTNHTQVTAEELMLLSGGVYPVDPTRKAYLVIGKKSDDARDWNGCSLPVHGGHNAYLPNFIESILADVLAFDSYATMNAMFRPGHLHSRWSDLADVESPEGGPIKEGFRNAEAIARLNACWVDCDYYKLGLTAGQVIGQVYDLQKEGMIPAPSYLKDSGRGLWIVWLLGLEARSFPEHVTQWRAIQRKLAYMFAHQSSDLGAGNDPSRLSRIVGSVNTTANRYANMVVLGRDAQGQAIRYKLSELAEALGVLIQRKPKLTQEKPAKLSNTAKGYAGNDSRKILDERRFWTLVETIRNRVSVGTRNNHNLILGAILRRRYNPEELAEAIDTAARRLWKLYEREQNKEEYTLERVTKEIRKAALGRKRAVMPSYQTIADLLAITTAEAQALRDLVPVKSQLASKPPRTWPAATGQEQLTREARSRKEKTDLVTQFLIGSKLINATEGFKALAELVEEKTTIKVSKETIRRIIKAHRPPPDETQLELPLGE